jgi:hypothetical protein
MLAAQRAADAAARAARKTLDATAASLAADSNILSMSSASASQAAGGGDVTHAEGEEDEAKEDGQGEGVDETTATASHTFASQPARAVQPTGPSRSALGSPATRRAAPSSLPTSPLNDSARMPPHLGAEVAERDVVAQSLSRVQSLRERLGAQTGARAGAAAGGFGGVGFGSVDGGRMAPTPSAGSKTAPATANLAAIRYAGADAGADGEGVDGSITFVVEGSAEVNVTGGSAPEGEGGEGGEGGGAGVPGSPLERGPLPSAT